MDSFTQIALGAAVGEAVAGKKLGNKALVYGAIAGTIPDLDVFIGKLMTTVDAISFHRGFTHSILFAILFSPLFGYLLHRIYRKNEATFKDWTLLFFWGFVTHAMLDAFTTWGTRIFWPFDYRIAFKSIFVIDPLYTLPLTICLVWLAFLNRKNSKRQQLNRIGLFVSTSYLLLTVIIKLYINTVFEQAFEDRELAITRYDTRPAPLNTILWTANAETNDGYFVGYYSLLDSDKEIDFFYFPKNHELLASYIDDEDVRDLTKICKDWYTVQPATDGLILNDLRFGQRTGWTDKNGDFVFSFYITQSGNQVTITEVEKDFSDGRQLISALWQRMLGNK